MSPFSLARGVEAVVAYAAGRAEICIRGAPGDAVRMSTPPRWQARTCSEHRGAPASRRPLHRAQLLPAAGRAGRGGGCVGHRRRRPPLPRLPGRVLRAQLRAPAPRPARGGARPARPGDPDQPGLPQRPARTVLPRPRRPGRHGAGAADEHRGGGGGDGDQGLPQVGLRPEGPSRRPGQHRRGGRQLPRPHHHHRRASPPTRWRARVSVRSRRASGSCRTATRSRCRTRSTTRPSPSCSSRSRARPA